MPARLTLALVAIGLALAAPATASAAPPNHLLLVQSGTPEAVPASRSTVPLGFHSSAGQAMLAAEHNSTLEALHRRLHPLSVHPFVWRSVHAYWYVILTYKGKIVADANVSPAGRVTGVWTGKEALAPYTHGNLAAVLDSWWILLPGSLLFLLAFLDPRRLRRMAHLDALAVLAFLVSFLFLAHGSLEPSVWLAYPPLIYLLGRLLWIGSGRGRPAGRLAPLLSTRVLAGGLLLILAARIVASLLGRQEIDVGYESVIGAFRSLHHLPLYWNDPNHGDTYGPFAYLAYVPFELVFPWTNTLSKLTAADAAAIFFDLATVVSLLLLGRRLRGGSDGTRLGLVLAWAWAACPLTTYALVVHTNDALISMLGVVALLAISSPAASGAILGVAAAAKFSPAGLLPLLAAPRRRGLKPALVCAGAFTAVVALAIFSWLPPQGFGFFWQRTIGFQLTRTDVFSPWALHPSLHPIQLALEVLAVALALGVALVPRQRSLAQVCALAGAVTIAIQLPAQHWGYYYILWFLPFALVALMVGEGRKSVAPVEEPDEEFKLVDRRSDPDLVAAGS